jgi:predicted nucleic-acid-binding protein
MESDFQAIEKHRHFISEEIINEVVWQLQSNIFSTTKDMSEVQKV